MQSKTMPTEDQTTKSGGLDLSKIQTHARQIQRDLDSIKEELDAMKNRFAPKEQQQQKHMSDQPVTGSSSVAQHSC